MNSSWHTLHAPLAAPTRNASPNAYCSNCSNCINCSKGIKINGIEGKAREGRPNKAL